MGRQTGQLRRPSASSTVRRPLHVGRNPFPQQWISAVHATCSISGQMTQLLETPTHQPNLNLCTKQRVSKNPQ